MSKNDEFCIENEELCIQNEGLFIKTRNCFVKNDDFCRRVVDRFNPGYDDL